MKLSLTTCFAALGLLTLAGCLSTKEPECHSSGYVPIVNVSGPKTTTVNQPAVFILDYALGNDCGTFGSVSAVPNGNTQQIGVTAAYDGCACNSTTTTAQTTYQFQASTAGTYYLKFVTSNNGFITDTVVVR